MCRGPEDVCGSRQRGIDMIHRFLKALSALSFALAVAACAVPSAGSGASVGQQAPLRIEHGTIESIQVYRSSDGRPVNVGTLLGGIAGGVIAHQVGGGTGNTVATIGGA